MTYQEAEAFIHAAVQMPTEPSLQRMLELMNRLGNPQEQLKYIHIAGTNGKGSAAVMCASALQQAGYRVGMYTSPYVLEFRERFQINGEMIPRDTFAELVGKLRQTVEQLACENITINEFERNTALAFLWFAVAGCDIVCLETGLGGLYDATNVITKPLVSVIMAISLDHTAILGASPETIAVQKAGIIKPHCPTVVYPLQTEETMAVLMKTCAERQSSLILPNAAHVEIQECTPEGSTFSYSGSFYRLHLAGEHQIYNAVTVIEVLNQLRAAGFAVSEQDMAKGLAQAAIPARFECLSKTPYVILDGGHNVQGAQVLERTLRRFGKMPNIALLGMMSDKDYQGYLKHIAPLCEKIITVPLTALPRALPSEALAKAAAPFCRDVVVSDSLEQAIEAAAESLEKEGMLLVGGSLFLAAEARPLLMEKFGGK